MAEAKPPREGAIASGIAMIVLGLLVFVPSGLCTGVFVFGSIITSLSEGSEAGLMAVYALVIGGPFVFGGGALLWYGIKKLRG